MRLTHRELSIVLIWSAILSLAVVAIGRTAIARESEPASVFSAENPVGSLPGVELAKSITELTGVAISPLLGVSFVGAWHYLKTPEQERTKLPWFCHPLAWGLGFSLLGLCFLKDLAGPGTPALVKKPLDAAELFENKVSALIACAAFVPFVAAQMSGGLPGFSGFAPSGGVSGGGALVATVPLLAGGVPAGTMWILLPLCFAGFLVVWIVSHAINVLILLSPFGLIDSVLKALRLALVGSVVLVSTIHPVAGAILCAGIILVAALLAPWAFRLAVFGGIMAGDALGSLFFRAPAPGARLVGFLGHSGGAGFLARTFGHVKIDANQRIQFVCRRLFCGPERKMDLGAAPSAVLHRGLIFPSLSSTESGGTPVKPFVLLLPRYRGHMEGIVSQFGLGGARDALLIRGLKGALSWIREAVSPRRSPTSVQPPERQSESLVRR